MSLTLRITSYQRLSPGQSGEYTLGQGRCSIGRGPDNDWVLADPEMVLSKKHCTVEYRDGDYYLTDTSTNGVYVNHSEQRLGRGNSAKLSNTDTLTLGDYDIQVVLDQAASASAGAVDSLFGEQTEQLDLQNWQGERPVDPFAAPAADPLSTAGADPLGLESDDSTAEEDWRKSAEFDHLPSEHAFFQAPGVASEPPHDSTEPVAMSPESGGDSVIPDDWEDSLIFKSSAPPAKPAAATSPQPPENTDEGDDPFAFLDTAPPIESIEPTPPAAEPPADPEPSPEPPAAEDRPPAPAEQPVSPVTASPVPPSPAVATPTEGDPVLAAFLRGCGLQPSDLPAGMDVVPLVEQFGKLYRQTAEGMLELLRARSNIKNEFRIERTMVGPVANNPLKILPTVEEAMKAMLGRQDGIWMSADRAIAEGFEDIRAHELAMIAGMQAALGQLLERFDPVTLEEELGEYSRLANLMAGGRKARYWDAFTRLYGKLAARAEDDFQDLFRKEFAVAYEEQLDKLRQR